MKTFESMSAYVNKLFIGKHHAHRMYMSKTFSQSAWSRANILVIRKKKLFFVEKKDEKTTSLSGKCSISLSSFVWYSNITNVPKATISAKKICITHQANTCSK